MRGNHTQSLEDRELSFIPHLDLDYTLISESQIDWHDGATSVLQHTTTPSNRADTNMDNYKKRGQSSSNSNLKSPSLFSDSDCEVVNSSLLEKDLPQFVLSCPRKPIIILNDLHKKARYDNFVHSDESHSPPSPSLLTPTESVLNISGSSSPDKSATKLSNSPQNEDSYSPARGIDMNRIKSDIIKSGKNSPLKLKSEKEMTRESYRYEQVGDINQIQIKRSLVKMENIETPKQVSKSKENCFELNQYSISPLDPEAQEKFDIIDKCLLLSLAPVLNGCNSNNKKCDVLKKVCPISARRRKRLYYDDSSEPTDPRTISDCLTDKIDSNSTLNQPEKDSELSSHTINSRKKDVHIKVIPYKHEGIQEIKRLKHVDNEYLSLEVALKNPDLSGKLARKRKGPNSRSNNNKCSPSSRIPATTNNPQDKNLPCLGHHNNDSHSVPPARMNTRQSSRVISKQSRHQTPPPSSDTDSLPDAPSHLDTNSNSPLSNRTGTIPHQSAVRNINTRRSVRLKNKSCHSYKLIKGNKNTNSQSIVGIGDDVNRNIPSENGEDFIQHEKIPENGRNTLGIKNTGPSSSHEETAQVSTTSNSHCTGTTKNVSLRSSTRCLQLNKQITADPPQSKNLNNDSQTIDSQGFVPCLLTPDISTDSMCSPDPDTVSCVSHPVSISTQPFTPVLSDSYGENADSC